jgi:DNA-directed RNA polymerase I, II, and III subunit RPABC2
MESKYMDEDDVIDEEEDEIASIDDEDIYGMDGGTTKKRIVKNVKNVKNYEDDDELDDDDDDELDEVEDENELLDDDEYNDNDESNEDSILTTIKKNEMKQNFPNLDGSDYDDDDEEDEENDLQKFEENMQQNVIAEYHPEMRAYNYDEVETLTRVVRNDDGTIIDPLHRTLPFITRYERARVIGERAKQLNAGAKSFVEIDETVIDGYLIALKEFEAKAIPFIVQRPLPGGGVEMWKLKDLEII